MEEDIYLIMLRFGREKLEDGLTNQELVDYLNRYGHNISIHSTLLHQYFFKVYFAKDNVDSYPPNPSGRYYLRPECYMQLLEYENMQETRKEAVQAIKEAKQAKWIAIIAIILTLASLVVSIYQVAKGY